MIVQAKYTVNNAYYGKHQIRPLYLVLHSTGDGEPSAEQHYKYYNSPNCAASVHAFIDANTGGVLQTMPWCMPAMHVGTDMNYKSIAIEMCENGIKYTGGATFVIKNRMVARESAKITYDTAVELFSQLAVMYGIVWTNIVSHKELAADGLATNHADPEHLWNGLGLSYTMEGFREDVKAKMARNCVVWKTLDEVPEVYREWVEKAIACGALSGTGHGLDLTRDMCRMITIMGRRGVFNVR